MRFKAVLFCALALAFPAAAQPTDWKVDVSKWSRPGDEVVPGRRITVGTDLQSATPALGIGIGSLSLMPSFQVWPRDDTPDLLKRPLYDDSVELGLNGYLKDHPRLMLIGKYLYRRAHSDDERRMLTDRRNHLPEVSRGNKISLGFSCKFPLTNCFGH